jgi:hypothetical protein
VPAISKSRPAPSPSAIVNDVTAKEKLLALLPNLTEAQAERALIAAEAKPGDTIDDWGNLSTLHEVAFGESMRRLAEDERAAGHEPWKRDDLA